MNQLILLYVNISFLNTICWTSLYFLNSIVCVFNLYDIKTSLYAFKSMNI